MADKVPAGFFPEETVPEGFVPEETPTMDALKSLRAGGATGVAGIPGAAGDVQKLVSNLGIGDWLTNKVKELFPNYYAYAEGASKKYGHLADRGGDVLPNISLPTTEQYKKGTGLDQFDYTPQSKTGEYLKTIGEFAPGALTGGVGGGVRGITGNLIKFGIAPGAASEFAGQTFKDTNYEHAARILTGLATPGLTHFAMSPFRVGGPAASEAAHAARVARLRDEGFHLSPGEVADNKGLRFAESEMNPEGYKGNLEATTRLATRQVGNGRGGTYETPVIEHGANGTVDTMLNETGQRFEDLIHRNTLHADPQLGLDLTNLQNRYTRIPGAYDADAVAALHGYAQHISDLFRGNGAHPATGLTHLTGEQYQRLRSSISDAAMGAEGQRSRALHDLNHAFDDAMERSIAATNPADAGHFPAARRDYRNALVIADASRAKNVTGAEGYITPAAIESAANKVYGSLAHQRGRDPFDWAPAAKAVLKTEPNSGTAARGNFRMINQALGSVFGGLAGGIGGHAAGMKDPVEALLIAEHLGGVIGNQMLPAIERPIYAAMAPWLRNQWTRSQARPYASLPGLLTAEQSAQQ